MGWRAWTGQALCSVGTYGLARGFDEIFISWALAGHPQRDRRGDDHGGVCRGHPGGMSAAYFAVKGLRALEAAAKLGEVELS